MEIAPGIHRIGCRFGAGRMVYVHLLIGDSASLLVDTGCAHNPVQEILPYMAQIGFDPARLTWIAISHSDLDHQGGNAPMRAAAPQARLLCHRLDEPWVADTEALIRGRYSQFEADHDIGYGEAGKAGIRTDTLSTPMDLTVQGGDTLRLGSDWIVELIHTPGHTWGHLAVWDPRSRTLISGEAAMGRAIPDEEWNAAMPPTYCYVETYLATQDHLLRMEIAQMAPAHWPLMQGVQVAEFITQSRLYVLEVEEALLGLAAAGAPFTLRAAIETLGPTLGHWPAGANQDFSYGMLGNLKSLTERGRLATERNADNLVTWRMP
jgi:glyoxylase-like metal-dependent hydrolase (beta-lactamase superfamily II)